MSVFLMLMYFSCLPVWSVIIIVNIYKTIVREWFTLKWQNYLFHNFIHFAQIYKSIFLNRNRCGSRGTQGTRPLDSRFWGPKIEHFWALFNFSIIRSAYHFFDMLLFHSSNSKNFHLNMVNSKFHLIQSFFEYLARFLLFHV